MPDATNWLDEFHDGINATRDQMCFLGEIADALILTGNKELALHLDAIRTYVLDGAERAELAVAKHIDEEYQSAQSGVARMLNTFADYVLSQ